MVQLQLMRHWVTNSSGSDDPTALIVAPLTPAERSRPNQRLAFSNGTQAIEMMVALAAKTAKVRTISMPNSPPLKVLNDTTQFLCPIN